MRLILCGNHGEFVILARLQACLHDRQRLKEAAEFVAAPDLDMVGEISGGDAFGDVHGGEHRPAQRIGKAGRDQQADQRRADCERQHGGMRPGTAASASVRNSKP